MVKISKHYIHSNLGWYNEANACTNGDKCTLLYNSVSNTLVNIILIFSNDTYIVALKNYVAYIQSYALLHVSD